jgi:hypothetical protein
VRKFVDGSLTTGRACGSARTGSRRRHRATGMS